MRRCSSVITALVFEFLPRIGQAEEDLTVQGFIAQPCAEAFDVAVSTSWGIVVERRTRSNNLRIDGVLLLPDIGVAQNSMPA